MPTIFAEDPEKYNEAKKLEEVVEQYKKDKNNADATLIYRSFRGVLNSYYMYVKFGKKSQSVSLDKFEKFMRGTGVDSIGMMRAAYSNMGYSEIWSDLNFCFARLLGRYEDTGKCFAAYFLNAFHYEFARTIFKTLKDPLANNYVYYNFSGEEHVPEHLRYEFTDDLIDYMEDITGIDGYLNYGWLNDDLSENFDCTDKDERLILMLYYQENMTDGTIAKLLRRHINYVNEKRGRAIKKLCKKHKLEYRRTRRSGKKSSIAI